MATATFVPRTTAPQRGGGDASTDPAPRPRTSLARRLAGTRVVPAVAAGVVGFTAAVAGSWIPSFWGDEAASVMSAQRSIPSLLVMLTRVDAVHGVYYLFLHFWILAFGASELSVRLPSAIAVGLGAAGLFVLVHSLATPRRSALPLAAAAALVFAILPRTNYFGADARSYALSTAAIVWLTVLLIALIRRRSTSRLAWLGYALGLAAAIYLFLFLGMMVVVHAMIVFGSRRFVPVRRRYLQSTGVTLVAILPILVFGIAQRGQIEFIGSRHFATAYNILVDQWFGRNLTLSIVAFALMALAVGFAVLRYVRRGRRSPLTELALVWAVVPTLLLVGANLISPSYDQRYLSMTAPGVALLIVMGLRELPRRWPRILALVAVVAITIPTDVGQRLPYAKDGGSDIAQTAALIAREATPGDAVVFDRSTRPSRDPRLGLHLFPQDYAGLRDVGLATSYQDRPGLWDTTYPTIDLGDRLAGVQRVWLEQLSGTPDQHSHTNENVLESFGYVEVSRQRVNRTIVYEFERQS